MKSCNGKFWTSAGWVFQAPVPSYTHGCFSWLGEQMPGLQTLRWLLLTELSKGKWAVKKLAWPSQLGVVVAQMQGLLQEQQVSGRRARSRTRAAGGWERGYGRRESRRTWTERNRERENQRRVLGNEWKEEKMGGNNEIIEIIEK